MYRDVRVFFELAIGEGGTSERIQRVSRSKAMTTILMKMALSQQLLVDLVDIFSLVGVATSGLK